MLLALRSAIQGEAKYHNVCRMIRTDGEVRYVESWGSVQHDAEGTPTLFLGTALDITEQKRNDDELQDLYHNAPCGYHSLGPDGVFLRVNNTLLSWLGYSREEVIGRDIRELMTPASLAQFEQHYQTFKERGHIHGHEFAMVRKDGSLLLVSLSATVIRDSDGRFLMTRSMTIDITEQRRIELQSQESEKLFRAVFQNAMNLLCLLDGEGKILAANPSALRFSGRSEAELRGLPLWEAGWWAPDARPQEDLRAALRRARTGEPVRYQDDLRSASHESRAFDISLTPIRDEEGRGVVLVAEAHDISGLKRIEHERLVSEASFRNAVEHAAIGMARVGINGRFGQVNRALASLLGYSEVALSGMEFRDVLHPKDNEPMREHSQALLHGKASHFHREIRLLHRYGHVVWTLLSASLVRSPTNEPLYYVAQFMDISQRKNTEEKLRASLEEKEALLKEVHHRVKNNVQVVLSLLQLQAQRVTDKEARGMIEDVQGRIHAIALLHEKLYQSETPSRINMEEYLRELGAACLSALGSPGVALRVEGDQVHLALEEAVPCGLITNELITNALKHAFPNIAAPEISIELHQQEGWLVLSVRDNGIGLPPPLDEANPEPQTSKSLGLHLVQTLARQLRGRVNFQTQNGTTCTITFPNPNKRREVLK
jgi:PAS domain S-box-containing protein